MHANHGYLYYVGSRALDRAVQRRTLCEVPGVVILAEDLRDGADAPEERAYASGFPGLVQGLVEPCSDPLISLEIAIDECLRILPCDAQLARETEGRQTVNDAEIDRLRPPSILRRVLFGQLTENLLRCPCVDVLVLAEGVDQHLIP